MADQFAEQLAALQIRLQDLVPTRRWDDLRGNAHDRAFVVAGAMQADLLHDLAKAVTKAIENGGTIEQFRKDFDAIVERSGWAYKGERNWRTRVIYRTNMSTSYAAGRLSQLRDPELQKVAPYWMYRHGGSADPRPQHLKWDRLTLPADHPFWASHYPPNGWGCSCYVTAVSRATAERQQGRFEEPPADQRGDIDPGWDHAPGNHVSEEIRNLVNAKAINLPQTLAGAMLGKGTTSAAFARWYSTPDAAPWPIGVLKDEHRQRIGAQTALTQLSADTARKQHKAHPELAAAEYEYVQVALQEGWVVQDGERALVFVLEQAGYVTVVKSTQTGKGVFISSFRRLSVQQAKRDAEIRRLRNKAGRASED